MSDSGADIGCDEHGYPIRVPVSPAGYACEAGMSLSARIAMLEAELAAAKSMVVPAAPSKGIIPLRALRHRFQIIGLRS